MKKLIKNIVEFIKYIWREYKNATGFYKINDHDDTNHIESKDLHFG